MFTLENDKERAYWAKAEKHTVKNDMKRFLKAVRREFDQDGIEYSELWQNMVVELADGQYFPYSCDGDRFIRLDEFKGLDTNYTGLMA